MTQEKNAQDQVEQEALVAEWLKATPGFFERHANLLAEIQLKNPHGDRAISLQERQLSVLREQNHTLNQRLSTMLHFGSQNDKTQGQMIAWLKSLLLAKTESEVREAITGGLGAIFAVELVKLVDGKNLPNFCGPVVQAGDACKALLENSSQSLAIVNLPNINAQLLLASTVLEKFTTDMGRFYLDQIAELAAASMTRVQG
jgi:uncharacterized protein YigA (DUF484 family)